MDRDHMGRVDFHLCPPVMKQPFSRLQMWCQRRDNFPHYPKVTRLHPSPGVCGDHMGSNNSALLPLRAWGLRDTKMPWYFILLKQIIILKSAKLLSKGNVKCQMSFYSSGFFFFYHFFQFSEFSNYLASKSTFVKDFLSFCCLPLKRFNLYS